MNWLEEKRDRNLEKFVLGLAAATLTIVLLRAARLAVAAGWLGADRVVTAKQTLQGTSVRRGNNDQ